MKIDWFNLQKHGLDDGQIDWINPENYATGLIQSSEIWIVQWTNRWIESSELCNWIDWIFRIMQLDWFDHQEYGLLGGQVDWFNLQNYATGLIQSSEIWIVRWTNGLIESSELCNMSFHWKQIVSYHFGPIEILNKSMKILV